MSTSVAIGEFSRLTHLTIKTLRHYHEQGLLPPYAVDDQTGYRRYSIDQVPAALLIGRLRGLDMPLAEVRRVIKTEDPTERDAIIAEHLARMEEQLDRTRGIVTSLRELLSPTARPISVQLRIIPDLRALAITETVDRKDIGPWCDRTFGHLYTTLLATGGEPAGPGGALYAEEFFTEARGDVTAYVPVAERPPLRTATTIAGGRYAVGLHLGALTNFDTTYAALGSYVAEHSGTRPGPIREIYLVSPPESTDEASFRTEVCWPIQEGSIA